MEKKDKPCSNGKTAHPLAFPNPNMPESKNMTLVACAKCGWYIKSNIQIKGVRVLGN